MDTFVKRFFPVHDAPGVGFCWTARKSLYAFSENNFRVMEGASHYRRHLYVNQEMTLAGLLSAGLNCNVSSYDGVTKEYLTPDGCMNINTLADAIKQQGGLQTATWSAHVNSMRQWSWNDNHTTLILNMLRYFMLRAVNDSLGNLNCDMGDYNDGHVTINMNQFFTDAYPATCNFATEWPAGTDDANYPTYTRLCDSVPATGADAVDLRGMSLVEARFVLYMLAGWRRRSRMRLDFELTRLCETIYYRSDMEITNLDNWIGREIEEGATAPATLGAASAWRAMVKYVTQNRVFDHFSTALWLFCGMAYQFTPSTAEGVWWLSLNWTASLPAFHSMRGRYLCINEGEAALISHRAWNEWGYINSKPEKVHLMALCFMQAVQTGCAVRAIRLGMDMDPSEVFNTAPEFYNATNFLSAAAAEALRGKVPLSGMSGVYINCADLRPDDYDDSRQVLVATIAAVTQTSYMTVTRGAGAAAATYLCVPWVPMAGYPTLIVPLNPFPFNSPLSQSGVIDGSLGELTRVNFRLKAANAWLVANFARLCGYDVTARFGLPPAGPAKYFAPNDVHYTWPVLFRDGEQDEDVRITGQTIRAHHWIFLPPIHTKFFSNIRLEYAMDILRRGVASATNENRHEVTEFGNRMRFTRAVTVEYQVAAGVAQLRGYITRDEQGFHYAEDAQPGVTPPPM